MPAAGLGRQWWLRVAEPRAGGAAAFLALALDLPDEPALLAPDLALVDADPAVAVFAVELDSSAGPAAFLVYAYDLAAVDAAGRRGEARFVGDLETLARAAALDAPGPRLVANARTDDAGYVLATSPATLRALTGQEAVAAAAGNETTTPTVDPTGTRRAAASALLRLLRAANEHAVAWAAAVAADRRPEAADPAALTPEEAELALFLVDDRSITPLLGTLDGLLTIARTHTGGGIDRPLG